MEPEPHPRQEGTRGQEVEATLWNIVGRLRARGWRFSLWEIQRAQDVIAYLFARLRRSPTDEELLRHLRPIFCARDSELAAFEDAFRQSAAPTAPADPTEAQKQRRHLPWRRAIAGMAVVACIAVVVLLARLGIFNPSAPMDSSDEPYLDQGASWTTSLWSGLALGLVTAVVVWLVRRQQLRRRPGQHTPGHDLELRWAIGHPLGRAECARLARALRTRSREEGNTLDLRRTVDASIRAGIRLTPRFVQHQRAPEYLAVIEQRSAQDVLAAHHAKIVDQISADGVVMRRVGLQPRSRLVIDPTRGRRQLEALAPLGMGEQVLLFAHDRALRDPVNGEARPWLTRFNSWSATTQVGPDVDQDRPLPIVHRALRDVRSLDPTWTPAQPSGRGSAPRKVPAIFEADGERWIEACAPSGHEVTRALDLLMTSLGPNGWYWLSACALYPEINYELTVSLGRRLRGDDGEPLATHLDIGVLAQLPWFRHAYMPDWLRRTLLGTLSHGQLVDARAALNQALISGVTGTPEESGSLSVAEPSPGGGRGTEGVGGGSAGEGARDRVYLDGSTLRRRHLAVAAPPQLLTAVRKRRHRIPAAARSSEAPSLRVRRALAWNNALLLILALMSTVATAILSFRAAAAGDWAEFLRYGPTNAAEGFAILPSLIAVVPGTVVLVFSRMAGRRRGTTTGISAVIFGIAALLLTTQLRLAHAHVLIPVFVGIRLVTLATTVAALLPAGQGVAVPWATFQRRCRRAFVLSSGFVVVLGASVLTANGFAWNSPNELILVVVTAGSIIPGTTVLAAAYFAGVRYVPLLAGGAVAGCGVGLTLANETELALVFGLPGLLALGGFYWQMRRVAERPPLDFWETRWHKWRWPLAMLPVVATATVDWPFYFRSVLALVFASIAAGMLLLHAITELISDRFAGTVLRFRNKLPFLLHFD